MEFFIAITMLLIAASLHTHYFVIISLIVFGLCAICSASHDIATDGFFLMTLPHQQQSIFVGIQSLFYQIAKLFIGGILVLGSGLLINHAHYSFVYSWSILFIAISCITLIFSLYHYVILPHNEMVNVKPVIFRWQELKQVIKAFFQLEQIWLGLLFVLLLRLGENMVLKIIPLFILDSRGHGGLGFNNTYLGEANVFILTAMMTASVIGGLCINRFGLKRCLIPFLFCSNIPHIVYIYLAWKQPTNTILVMGLQTIEYFATTFALAGYSMVLFYLVRNSTYKTAHFSFMSGIMVASVMVPSMLSGMLEQYLGYNKYFILVLFLLIPGLCLLPFIKIDPLFGKKIIN